MTHRILAASFIALAIASTANAQNLYWDANGNTAGAGSNPTGTWGTSVFWNDNSTGGAPAGAFTDTTANTNDLFFVAGPSGSSGNGNTTITVGGAQVANSLNFQKSGATTLSGGTSITLDGGINVNQFAFGSTSQGNVLISTPVILNASQTFTMNRPDTGATGTEGSFRVFGGIDLGANTLTIDGVGTTNFGSTAAIISGTGGITKNGTGLLTLSSGSTQPVNTFSGDLTINGGTVRQQTATSLGTGNININGGVLAGRFNSGITRALGSAAGEIRITGGVSGFSGEGTSNSALTITGTGSSPLVWGSTNFNPTQFVLQGEKANTNGQGSFTNNIDLNGADRTIRSDQTGGIATGGSGTFSGVISNSTGTAGLIKDGIGHHVLTATNTYNGTTTVNQGTLTANTTGALPGFATPGNVIVAGGATLGVRTGAWTSANIDDLRANATWSAATSELGLNTTTAAVTYASDITEALTLTKFGNNALTLTGNNTYGPSHKNCPIGVARNGC